MADTSVEEMADTSVETPDNPVEIPTVVKSGRPAIPVSREQVKLLQDRGFTARKMAEFFGCSHSLMYSHLNRFGMGQRNQYSTLSDEDLDQLVAGLHTRHPNAGAKMITSYLLAEEKKVQRQRIRDSLLRVDEDAVKRRKSTAITRRMYKVASPNSLWHMDGHMKLIRWGFTTHGCIDGFSRLIVFLKASTNNKASTVFKSFIRATLDFGLPAMVRSDHGGENRHVALFLNLVRGINHHLTGRSVHNQRIERLWRDVHTQVTDTFYKKIYKLEDEGVLEINNDHHISALQLVFGPEINKRLATFQCGWNKHTIRTAKNKTPEQLWMEGCLDNAHTESTAMKSVFCAEPTIEQQLEQGLQQYGLSLQQFDVEPENEDNTVVRFSDILEQDITLEAKFILAKNRLAAE